MGEAGEEPGGEAVGDGGEGGRFWGGRGAAQEAGEVVGGEEFEGGEWAEPGDLEGVPTGELKDDTGEGSDARGAIATVAEREAQAQAGVAFFELFDGPGVVLGRGDGFVEGAFLPVSAADHAHAVAVEGAEAEALALEFGEGDGIAVEGIVIPSEADAGCGGIAHGGDHLSEGVGGFEDGVGAEDEDEVGGEEAEAEVEDAGVGVGLGPLSDAAAGGADVGGGSVGAAAVHAEDDIGLEGLGFEGCEHGWQGGGGIGESDEDAEGGGRHGVGDQGSWVARERVWRSNSAGVRASMGAMKMRWAPGWERGARVRRA